MSPPKEREIIHAARYRKGKQIFYLLLRKIEKEIYQWSELSPFGDREDPLPILSPSLFEALHLARARWSLFSFCMLHCGFRYALPGRDEHGDNALFHQMIQSYSSSTGVYFDEELGYNCYVDFASQEARKLAKRL